jgi:predicted nucleic acid-binding protein
MITRNKVFVDASAWVALFNIDDKFHVEAASFWRQLPFQKTTLLTNDYIMSETYTHLRRSRDGLKRAVLAHETIVTSHLVELVSVNEDYRQQGWELFCQFTDKVMSFTDCVCFAMMHDLGLYQVFTFDQDFARAGFVVVP